MKKPDALFAVKFLWKLLLLALCQIVPPALVFGFCGAVGGGIILGVGAGAGLNGLLVAVFFFGPMLYAIPSFMAGLVFGIISVPIHLVECRPLKIFTGMVSGAAAAYPVWIFEPTISSFESIRVVDLPFSLGTALCGCLYTSLIIELFLPDTGV